MSSPKPLPCLDLCHADEFVYDRAAVTCKVADSSSSELESGLQQASACSVAPSSHASIATNQSLSYHRGVCADAGAIRIRMDTELRGLSPEQRPT